MHVMMRVITHSVLQVVTGLLDDLTAFQESRSKGAVGVGGRGLAQK